MRLRPLLSKRKSEGTKSLNGQEFGSALSPRPRGRGGSLPDGRFGRGPFPTIKIDARSGAPGCYSSAAHSVAKAGGWGGLNIRHAIRTAPKATIAMITMLRMRAIFSKPGGQVIVQGEREIVEAMVSSTRAIRLAARRTRSFNHAGSTR